MSLYLSRLILNPYSKQVIGELDNPYEMHRTLMQAFPSKTQGGPGRVLFRVDDNKTMCTSIVLVQSENKPDWAFLAEKDYLLKRANNPAFKEYEPTLRKGQRLRFLLKANPTVKKVFEAGKPGKRIGLYKEKEQADWFLGKAEQCGFKPTIVDICQEGKQTSFKHGNASTHFSVIFTGALTVTNPELFLQTIRAGIGSAKGFGFGLLSIAPIEN
ncbi:MAG: type I-E CRISPR-associated protein Cas6/Cse3/CasE [Dehalococcoidales bacterium]|nr:type I-E CRISPR-associated protein Cas6/Cse3/CasE [Dehalococcoidales bacterium]